MSNKAGVLYIVELLLWRIEFIHVTGTSAESVPDPELQQHTGPSDIKQGVS